MTDKTATSRKRRQAIPAFGHTVSVRMLSDLALSGGEDTNEEGPTRAVSYWLRRDIVRGVFAPGTKLNVDALSRFYETGFTPVREAILLASTTGLVTHEHQKGYRVCGVSVADFDDLMDTYQKLYRLALDLAMKRGGQTWEERVLIALHRSLKVPKTPPDGAPEARERWQLAYRHLHREILSGCASPILQDELERLMDRAERYVTLFASGVTDLERDSHGEHRAMVSAIVSGEIDQMHEMLLRYFGGGAQVRASIRKALAESLVEGHPVVG